MNFELSAFDALYATCQTSPFFIPGVYYLVRVCIGLAKSKIFAVFLKYAASLCSRS